jgi:hypothetical protein
VEHRARTNDAEQAIARAVMKHFGKGWCFIPDDLDAAGLAYDAAPRLSARCGPYWRKGDHVASQNKRGDCFRVVVAIIDMAECNFYPNVCKLR